MRKQTMISTGIILTLMGSNLILGEKYIIDNHNLEKKIDSQYELIEQNRVDKEFLMDVITIKSSENDVLSGEIKTIKKQLDNVKKENTTLKKENNQIKKILKERKEASKRRQLNMQLTFYGADCGGCSGITKTGIDVSNTVYYQGMRIVAADPRVIPLHSIIKIQTKKETYTAYVADTGSAIKNNILDVLVSSEKEAIQHGRQQAVVTIIREGKS